MAKLRDGSTYLANHLSANDYYSEKESVAGEWIGQGAGRLGLDGRSIGVHDEAFERLRCNRHPLTGRKLTARNGAGRIAFLDFQCSAPKSVSLLAVTFGDERLRQAHRDAVTVAFGELERFAARRVRGGDAAWSEQTAITGNLCAARFEHDASRALDAQLHTHLVTANATFDAKADKWFALTEREMVEAIRYAGKVYQNELARGTLAAGYEIEAARNDRGVVEGFEIVGVNTEDRAIASKRRAQIETEIATFRKKHGREPTTREIHGITTQTRSGKLAEITTAEVRHRQRADFSPERVHALDSVVDAARRRGPVAPVASGEAAALVQARNHLFERASVQRGHEVIAEALNQNLGGLSLEAVKQALAEGNATDCVPLKSGDNGLHSAYATREGLTQELSATAVVNGGRNACGLLGRRDFQPSERLSTDQRCAVQSLLESTDRVCALRGVAGAGKTFTLQEVQRGLVAANREVIACAPTTAAAAVLRGEGFATATTLADFLQNGEARHGPRLLGATVIVDEAGIASTRQGAELCALVKAQGARLILVGDSRQHSGVEAGDFLSIIENHSRLQTCELTDIRRQTAREYRGAVKLMAQGQARAGLEALDRLGWVKEGGADYVKRAAEHYVESAAAKRDVILVAPTWEEIHRLTDAVRAGLKKRGRLGESQAATVAEPLAWTKAQAETVANYRPGHLLTLHRPLREAQLPAGTTVEVVSVTRGRIRVRDAQRREADVSPRRHATAWTASAPRVIELAAGDRVLIRQNHRAAGLVNGEVLTLAVRDAAGTWHAHDASGRKKTIPADFGAFAHGYAVTSHKAQGRTCDEVIVCAARLDAKATYVAFSRARQQATGYTPDKTALFDALPATNRPRQAALDLWTPAHSRRLRWVRSVVERVRELLTPIVRVPEFTVVPPVLPPILKPRQAIANSTSSGRHVRNSVRATPAIRMRF
ncbi:MAG: relaxase domain-containing protein [Verrucomicrobia bacterium]|nr:relaxase domain-containing protein [Verrucomicrobiota bacterium]